METIALVGPSGSGKSHRALAFANDIKANLIIDDGLIIQEGRIIDGISAKNQTTKIGAIKTALFTDAQHRNKAAETIAVLQPERILILGTSRGMIERICQRLSLPKPAKVVNIEDLATSEEITTAKYFRKQLGKHVVPAPSVEVEQNFPNALIEKVQVILHGQNTAKQRVFEQSVIRPTFSYLGKIMISDKALNDIIKWVLIKFPGVKAPGKNQVFSEQGNTILFIQYTAEYGQILTALSRNIQAKVKEVVESHTGFNVLAIDVLVTGVARKSQPRTDKISNQENNLAEAVTKWEGACSEPGSKQENRPDDDNNEADINEVVDDDNEADYKDEVNDNDKVN
ncbi:MAG TPA: Asp23/Gls24 family envelope stress response protein [Desulfitobacteriaceae bacterium]|nr:Asp23/Gls24 family envelope stress response protein [Desulfitobacteriaceae bacterium]